MTTPAQLLDWYDQHARVLPWRVGPGDARGGLRADPYRVWLSEIMLQQTTVKAVIGYFERFTTRWPTVGDLAAAADEDVMAEWAGLGYYARARNLLKCARQIAAEGGAFPATEAGLLKLPGIGPYTAAAIAAIAFDAPAAVVDGNVERVTARYHALRPPLPEIKPAIRALAEAATPLQRPGDYAQAMMDLGATICTPRNPACGICPVNAGCRARAEGLTDQIPAKAPKAAKPVRLGHVFVGQTERGHLLLVRRPPKGLLGGTLCFPSSDWAEQRPEAAPPVPGRWTQLAAPVRHTFTHFHLDLTVHAAQGLDDALPFEGERLDLSTFDPDNLPSLMRKVFRTTRTEQMTHV